MARSGARQVTGALADWTGRSDDELRLALTVAGAAAALFAGVRFVNWLANMGWVYGQRADGR